MQLFRGRFESVTSRNSPHGMISTHGHVHCAAFIHSGYF